MGLGAGASREPRERASSVPVCDSFDMRPSFSWETGFMDVQHTSPVAGSNVARDSSHDGMHAVEAPVLIIAAVYLGLGLAIVLLHSGPVSIADDLALLNGAVTALALYAVFFQVAQARREGAERAAEQRREAALRADQLHAEYNSSEMQRPRIIAYEYLKFLKRDPALLAEFARNWVRDEDEDCRIPEASPAYGSGLTFNDYGAALDAVIAFFVRVNSHVRAHVPPAASGEGDRLQMIGSFFWSYWWRAGMNELITACQQAYDQHGSSDTYDRPYFIDALHELQRYSRRYGAPGSSSHPPAPG